jgi:hypothetical protein
MGINVDYINNQLKTDFDQEVKRREAEIKSREDEIIAYETANRSLQTENNFFNGENNYLKHSIDMFLEEEAFLYSEIEEKEKEKDALKDKKFTERFLEEKITLSNFLEKLNNYPVHNTNSNFYYKGVLINSFYELEFKFENIDKNFNDILRCRCVSIGTPNIRKNYTSLNFNGRRVEIEQNAEFQHDIQIRIICDEDADIYYKFKEYIDCTKYKNPYTLFNNSHIWIALDGFKVIKLNHITISDLGQLEFDNSPGSSVCFFNVTLKIIDYEFNTNILQKNRYDKLILDILENNKRIENIENEMNNAQKQIDENSIKINNNERIIIENNEIVKTKKEDLEFLKHELGTYFN